MTQSRRTGPPAGILVAATLCGLLAVPLLAAAGSLAASAVSEEGFASVFAGLLGLVVLGIAGVNVVGAVQLVQRGTARLAQLGGYLTIALTAMMLTGLMIDKSVGVAVSAALIFLAPAIVMLTLLGTRRSRRWLAARTGRDLDLGTGPRHAIREFH